MAIIHQYLNHRNGNVERYIGGPSKNCLTSDQLNKSIEIISQLMKNDKKELCLYIKFGFTNEDYEAYRNGSINSITIASGVIPANLEEQVNEFVGEASRYNAAFKIPGWVSYNAYKTTHDNILQIFIKVEYLEGILEPVEDEEESAFLTDYNPFSEILTEAYIGKEVVQSLFEQFKIVRASIKGKPYSKNIAISKEVLAFNRLVEKQFGYENFGFDIDPYNGVNAYTTNITIYQNANEIARMINALKYTSTNGFKYDKMGRISTIVCFSYGLMDKDDFSDNELFGAFLHEIGHSFFLAVSGYDIASLRSNMSSNLHKINNIITNRISSGVKTTTQDIIQDFKDISVIVIKNISSPFKSFYKRIKYAIKKIKLPKFRHEAFMTNLTSESYAYYDEKFADTFSAIYGYGPDVQSFLLKSDQVLYKYNPQPKKGILLPFKFNMFCVKEMTRLMDDPHPSDIARAKSSIDYLKRELAKNTYDPKIKKELISQIIQLEHLIDEYLNFPKDEDNVYLRRQYYKKLYESYGGDPRESDNPSDDLFDQIDKVESGEHHITLYY